MSAAVAGQEDLLKRLPETPGETVEELAKVLGWRASTCRGRSCNAKLYFVRNTQTGRQIPIDASCGLNHFITCPDRARFRRRS